MKKSIMQQVQQGIVRVLLASVFLGFAAGNAYAQVFPFGPEYVLNNASIVQNADTTWSVGYDIPTNTRSENFSLTVGENPSIRNAAIIGGLLVFKVPETLLVPGTTRRFLLKDESLSRVRATNDVVVPAGLPPQYFLDRRTPIGKNADGSWRIAYRIPSSIRIDDFSLVVGSKGEVKGGIPVDDTIVFKVPTAMFSLPETETLILKNLITGKLYDTNGGVTQGVIAPAAFDASRYIGGLLVTFPPEQQDIQQTSAVIKVTLRALVDLPFVDSSYIWSRSGDPSSNIELQLIKIPGPLGLKSGAEATATLVFSGLKAGTTYTFVLKNKVTNTVSEPIQFKTPTTAGEKSYVTYTGALVDYSPNGGYDAPPGGAAVTDDISDKGIVPKCGRTPGPGVAESETAPCGYRDFLQLISNVIKYALIIFGPIVAVLILYTGAEIIWYGKLPDKTSWQSQKLQAAKARMVKIAIGLLIILSAWVTIATITRELGVKEGYTLLDLFTGN